MCDVLARRCKTTVLVLARQFWWTDVIIKEALDMHYTDLYWTLSGSNRSLPW